LVHIVLFQSSKEFLLAFLEDYVPLADCYALVSRPIRRTKVLGQSLGV